MIAARSRARLRNFSLGSSPTNSARKKNTRTNRRNLRPLSSPSSPSCTVAPVAACPRASRVECRAAAPLVVAPPVATAVPPWRRSTKYDSTENNLLLFISFYFMRVAVVERKKSLFIYLFFIRQYFTSLIQKGEE